jgi:uncharacterized membrane protein
VKNTYSWAILTICVSGTLAVSAQTYRITDLGTLGTNASFATGINASGQVSGIPRAARTLRGLGSNWVTVPGSVATNHVVVPLDQANGSVFYRLAVP